MNKSAHKLLKELLIHVANGRTTCIMSYPNFRDIKVKIKSINLENPVGKPIGVKILERGLKREQTYFREQPFVGEVEMTRQVNFTEEFAKLEWLHSFVNEWETSNE